MILNDYTIEIRMNNRIGIKDEEEHSYTNSRNKFAECYE